VKIATKTVLVQLSYSSVSVSVCLDVYVSVRL